MRAFVVVALVLGALACSAMADKRLFLARHMRGRERVTGSACTDAGGECLDASSQQCPWTSDNPKEFVSGLCPGAANIKCCKPVGGAQAKPAPAQSQGSGAKKRVCVTFDDGPYSITPKLIARFIENKIPVVWFFNAHNGVDSKGGIVKEDQAAVASAVDLIKRSPADAKQIIANHMAWHDIMGAGQYRDNYYPEALRTSKAAFGVVRHHPTCLQDAGQKDKFNRYILTNIKRYKDMGANEITLTRLNGDGRFMDCLIAYIKAGGPFPPQTHVGWHVELTSPGTFPDREKAQPGQKPEFQPAAPGVLISGNYRDGAVLLAHDLHWTNGRDDNLFNYLNSLKSSYEFVSPVNGYCGPIPLPAQ